MSTFCRVWLGVSLVLLPGLVATPVRAASHLWVINEVFSTADGSVQFVEMYNGPASANEINLASKSVTSAVNGAFHTFPSNLPSGSTADKYILLATQSFADLPGAPTPDHIIARNSFSIDGDTIQWHVYAASILSFASGDLPTDGRLALNRGGSVALNSPTNFAGETGSVDASAGPPAVPDGKAGTTPMTATRLDVAGSMIELRWDTGSCAGASDHILVYGERSQLPASLGGIYTLTGGVCTVGAASPFIWTGAPSATDGSGLIWWLVLVRDGNNEGSWGLDGAATERGGTGPNGSSGQCGVVDKNASNACGR